MDNTPENKKNISAQEIKDFFVRSSKYYDQEESDEEITEEERKKIWENKRAAIKRVRNK